MDANILACITTREQPPRDIACRVEVALRHAEKLGCQTQLSIVGDAYGIASCRNKAVAEFLGGPYSHLWFIDDDVGVQPDALELLLGADAPIVAGCYPSVKRFSDCSTWAYLTVKDGAGWRRKWFDGTVEVTGAGTGCMLIRREVLEALGFPWFVWRQTLNATGGIDRVSDDIDFCERAGQLGFKIMAHGNVRCSHTKAFDVANLISETAEPRESVWRGPLNLVAQKGWPPYGTHVPVLRALGLRCEDAGLQEQGWPTITHAVEYGSGCFSTPTLLDRRFFPKLERLTTLEGEPHWAAQVNRQCGADARLDLRVRPLAQMAREDVGTPQLVFIDCDAVSGGGHDYSARRDLIARWAGVAPVCVVHDSDFADVRPYVLAADARYKREFTPPSGPRTVVMSSVVDPDVGVNWLRD